MKKIKEFFKKLKAIAYCEHLEKDLVYTYTETKNGKIFGYNVFKCRLCNAINVVDK